ncbi:MAG: hypothetical protein KAG66_12135, partial [Methylococcales bacterium]|nr:hypothetical protein [Methylococcales bacterium]
MGFDPMPWQVDGLMLVGEMVAGEEGGLVPAYREVGFTVPRQSGKTVNLLSFAVHRNVAWDRPTNVAWTAQDGAAARKKWLKEIFPLLESESRNGLFEMYRRSMRGKGDEAAIWRNGSRIDLLGSSASGGHGETLDAYVMDELFADEDGRRAQSLDPAIATVADAQAVWASTAGNARSTVLNQKVKAGRRAVAADSGRGIAYLEYSAPDGWDPLDESSFWGFMPALGLTLPVGWVLHARDAKFVDDVEGFARAYGNVAVGVDSGAVLANWGGVCAENVSPDPGEGV